VHHPRHSSGRQHRSAPARGAPLTQLMQDAVMDDEDSAQLSECCFNACVTLKNAIRGECRGDLSELEELVLEELERCVTYPLPSFTVPKNRRVMRKTEQTFRSATEGTPRAWPNKAKSCVRDLQRILQTLYALNPPLGEHPNVNECRPHLMPAYPRNAIPPPVSESGMSSPSVPSHLA
jgi:hypothetical protein